MPYKDPEKRRKQARRYYARRKNDPDFKKQLKDITNRYRERHLDEIRERDRITKRKFRRAHPEKNSHIVEKFKQTHPGYFAKKEAEYRKKYPERQKESNRRSHQKHKDCFLQHTLASIGGGLADRSDSLLFLFQKSQEREYSEDFFSKDPEKQHPGIGKGGASFFQME